MAKKAAKKPPTQVEANVNEIFSKSEKFIEVYKNHIFIGVGVVILIVMAILGIRQFYFLPKEKDAQASIYPGENYMANQKWDLALNGDGKDYTGFLGIIDDYGFTKTGGLAKAYAGMCYYHLNKSEEALEYLKKYKANDKIVGPIVTGMIGDCYINLNKVEDGIKYFIKAASEADSEYLSSIYLKKAGTAYESVFDYANAVKVYQKIKSKYPASQEASDIDKYIERAKLQIK